MDTPWAQISTNGGDKMRRRPDGRELYYLAPDNKLMAVEIKTIGSVLSPGVPCVLFDTQAVTGVTGGAYFPYAVSRDGQKFLITIRSSLDSGTNSTPLTVIVNWATSRIQ